MFVISVKRLFDYSGNRLEKPEYKYFSYEGSLSTGYPTWDSFYLAETFKTAEQAKKVYMENLRILACSWGEYDRDSVRIHEIKFKPVEKLPWKKNKD